MKCDGPVGLIKEVFICYVLHSALIETRSLLEIPLLFTALKTQNVACIRIQLRGMMNSLLSGVAVCIYFGLFLEATDLPTHYYHYYYYLLKKDNVA